MRLRRCFLSLGFLALLGLFAVMPAAAAADTTIVWQVNLTVPLINKAALGTLTTTVDSGTGRGTWSFQGTIGGQFATASGTGTIAGSGSTATATITSIDTWQMPGIDRPALPASAQIRAVGNTAYVTYRQLVDVPVATSPPISFPLQPGAYTLTSPASGEQGVPGLPNTGGEPAVRTDA